MGFSCRDLLVPLRTIWLAIGVRSPVSDLRSAAWCSEHEEQESQRTQPFCLQEKPALRHLPQHLESLFKGGVVDEATADDFLEPAGSSSQLPVLGAHNSQLR